MSENRGARLASRRTLRFFCFALAIAFLAAPTNFSAQSKSERHKVPIRAITAFAEFDRNRAKLPAQFDEAMQMLQKAKAAFVAAGYEVQSLRVTAPAFAVLTRGLSHNEVISYYADLAALAKKTGVPIAIGPPFLHSVEIDSSTVDLYAEILVQHPELFGSLIVADENGVNWKAVRAAAHIIKNLEERTPLSQGNSSFAAAAEVPEFGPFYPASYFVPPGKKFGIAIQGADIVAPAFAEAKGDFAVAKKAFSTALNEQTSAISETAEQAAKASGWEFAGLDNSTAPAGDSSVGAAFESLLGAPFGSAGTLSIASMITDVLHEKPRSAGSGYSGLMMPVIEDSTLAKRWTEGRLTLDQILQYSAVCGTGLDTIPLPGDITEDQLYRIVGDVATLAAKLHKPLTARLLPVLGKKAGDRTEFDSPNLINTVLQPLR
jgi:hypothetical protein